MAYEAILSSDAAKGVHYEEILQLYNDLMTLDSSHYQYYKDAHSVAFLHKVLSLSFSCESQVELLLLKLSCLMIFFLHSHLEYKIDWGF